MGSECSDVSFLLPHTVRKVSVCGVFWSVFFCIRTEYGEMLRISPYSVQIRENADQKNSEYGHFSRSVPVNLFSIESLMSIKVIRYFSRLDITRSTSVTPVYVKTSMGTVKAHVDSSIMKGASPCVYVFDDPNQVTMSRQIPSFKTQQEVSIVESVKGVKDVFLPQIDDSEMEGLNFLLFLTFQW